MIKSLKITLILSLLGILILSIISQNTVQKIQIQEITSNNLGQEVLLEAKIASLKEFPEKSFQILLLNDSTGEITGITNSKSFLNINKSYTYLIKGKIQEYNNTIQININKIIKK